MAPRAVPAHERFWRYVDKRPDGCWLWTGGLCCGYGIFRLSHGASFRAHRYSYELHRGAIPRDLQVCHRCDVRNCVNPDHLFVGTAFDNMRDASRKGRIARGDRNASRLHPSRLARGERNGFAKLTAPIVQRIRADRSAGMVLMDLAVRYGISRTQVHNIVKRRQWAHI